MPTALLTVVLVVYVAASLAAFVAYGWDKRAAVRGRARVPEKRLHLLELAGGWPGAFIAQRLFRHKVRKPRYQIVFWTIVVLHAGVWLFVLWWVLTAR